MGAGRIAVWLGRAAIRLLRLVPPARLASFAAALGGTVGPLLPRHRVALDNLRRAFPEKGEDECRAIRRDMWRHLFRVIADPGASPLLRGKAADDVEFHAGVPGAPDGYVEAEILEMSKQLASAAVKDVLT